jgi:uncharacterized membrane protein HdeD (DUF308 family)
MTEASPSAPTRRGVAPFTVFFLVAMLAAAGAVFEISYWVGVPAFAPSTLPPLLGILGALVAFFVWGWRAPPNE